MRIAFIDTATGDIRAVMDPEVQVAPMLVQEGEGIVVISAGSSAHGIAPETLIAEYRYDLARQDFAKKAA